MNVKLETPQLRTEQGIIFLDKLNQNLITTPYALRYWNDKYQPSNFIRKFSDIKKIIIHCTATDSKKWDNPLQLLDYDLHANHISSKGCPTATYHYYIEQDADVSQLVSAYFCTWHCANSYVAGVKRNHNFESLAVCINHGGKKTDIIEPEQFLALADTLCYIFDWMDWPYTKEELLNRVWYHRDFANKLCPGENLSRPELFARCLEQFKVWGNVA